MRKDKIHDTENVKSETENEEMDEIIKNIPYVLDDTNDTANHIIYQIMSYVAEISSSENEMHDAEYVSNLIDLTSEYLGKIRDLSINNYLKNMFGISKTIEE